MSQQIVDRDRTLCRLGLECTIFGKPDTYFHLRELRQVTNDRVCQPQVTPLYQTHDRSRHDRLGQAGDTEFRIKRHRRASRYIAHSKRLQILTPCAIPDDNDISGARLCC